MAPYRMRINGSNGSRAVAQRMIAHQALRLKVMPPKLLEDKFTQQADRVIGLVQRLWPVAGEAKAPKRKVVTSMGFEPMTP